MIIGRRELPAPLKAVVTGPKIDRYHHPQWGLSRYVVFGETVISQVEYCKRFVFIDSPLISQRSAYQNTHFRVVRATDACEMVGCGLVAIGLP